MIFCQSHSPRKFKTFLLKLPRMQIDNDDNWDPFGNVWYEQPDAEDAGFWNWYRGLTKPQQVLFPTHWLCCEVYNGGFHQYFTNPTGHHAPEAILSFRELRLHDIAEIVQKAVSVFGSEFPRTRDGRQAFLAKFEGDDSSEWDPFFFMDDEFYEAIKIAGAPDLCDEDRFTQAAKEYVLNFNR